MRTNIWDVNFDEERVMMYYFNLNRLWNNLEVGDAYLPLVIIHIKSYHYYRWDINKEDNCQRYSN